MSEPKRVPRTPRDLKCTACNAKPGERCHGTKRNVHGARMWAFNRHAARQRMKAHERSDRQLLLDKLSEHAALVAAVRAAVAFDERRDEATADAFDAALASDLVQRAIARGT